MLRVEIRPESCPEFVFVGTRFQLSVTGEGTFFPFLLVGQLEGREGVPSRVWS